MFILWITIRKNFLLDNVVSLRRETTRRPGDMARGNTTRARTDTT
jgi:hypothetical protein